MNDVAAPGLSRLSLSFTGLIGTVFVLSGATSLVYQVAWVRMLSLFFGSDVFAAAITLSVFMGGLSLGSWLASRIGDRVSRPLVAYGACEILIALSAIAFPYVLDAFRESYSGIYQAQFELRPWLYHGFRVLVAVAALLVPTALMGATLPFVIRQFADRNAIFGRRVGQFYAVNTLGALAGTIVTGFLALPMLGVARTVGTAAVVNLAIGLVAVAVGFRLDRQAPADQRLAKQRAPALTAGQWAVIGAMALSGFAALALEVVWMRILVQSFSATVYAFAIMLASFLFGIFYGSHVASRWIDQHERPLSMLATVEFWIAASVGLVGLCSYLAPSVFGGLVWGLTGLTGGAFGLASIVAQAGVAFVLIAGPTTLLGLTFPIAVKAFTLDIGRRAESTGVIYAANTAGALVGALAAGFLLLPTLGSRGSLVLVAATFAGAGAIAAWRSETPSSRLRTAAVPLAIAVIGGALVLMLPTQTVVNYNMQRSTRPEVLYHGEGVSHTVDIVRNERNNVIMMVDGNVEADTTLVQRRHFVMKGHLPLLLHPDPREVAVIGLGLGITLRATERHPTVERIRLIELTPEMVRAHRRMPELTGNVLASSKLALRIDDGRNFMAMTNENFDMVTADPIHPRITGVGYLYTREYYELIKRRLRPGGVVVQWMPMYQIAPRSFDVAFRTFAAVFPNASFWYVRGHGLFVATIDDFTFDYRTLAARFAHPNVAGDFATIGIAAPAELLGHLLMDAEHIRRYVAREAASALNTDDNADLEYRTPFEMLGRTDAIVANLLPFAGWDMRKIMRGATAEDIAAVERAFQERLRRMPAELKEPID
ncbi:MAG: fused MFS/spermidine synthase [Alphaproteobacteria bacterium]|nr:fused MFS/spermidine synthase [Alphaproteobacteria bacterium]